METPKFDSYAGPNAALRLHGANTELDAALKIICEKFGVRAAGIVICAADDGVGNPVAVASCKINHGSLPSLFRFVAKQIDQGHTETSPPRPNPPTQGITHADSN